MEAAGAEEEDEEEDEDLLDDEAMFKMDGTIANVLSGIQQQKQAVRAARESLLNLKFRVLGLLESLAKKCPDSPHLPGMVLPLLNAVRTCPGDQPLLQSKTAALLVDRVCKGKSKTSAAREVLEAGLTRAWALASRSDIEAVGKAASSALLYLVKVAAGSGHADLAAQALTRALTDFFQSKKCRLPARLLEDMLLRAPELGTRALPDLMARATTARNQTLQLRALHLLAGVMQHAQQGSAEVQAALPAAALAKCLEHCVQPGAFSGKARRVEALQTAARVLELARKKKLVADLGALTAPVARAAAQAAAGAGEEPKKVQALLGRVAELAQSKGGEDKHQQEEGKKGKAKQQLNKKEEPQGQKKLAKKEGAAPAKMPPANKKAKK